MLHNALEARPYISILVPFNPKITASGILAKRLDTAVTQVKDELDRHYAKEETYALMVRLRKLVAELNYSTYKRSIAIYLSADVEKVFYLDMDVNECVVADGALNMRHIIRNKADIHNCLLLLLSGERVKIFHAGAEGLRALLSVTPHNMSTASVQGNLHERANVSDPSAAKAASLEKFMRYADTVLNMILPFYPFPVIVMAAERTAGHFKKITGSATHIAAYVHGNYEHVPDGHLLQAIAPYMEQWDKVKQQHLLAKLEKAMGAGKVAAGIRNVCKEAKLHKGRMLLVERNFKYKMDISVKGSSSQPFYLYDKVDEAILNVLESGGEVEFVDDDALAEYGQVALIKYY